MAADHPMFQGKVALVTGGSSGIGRTTSLAFAAHGAKVAVASRRADEGEETVRLIQAAGGEAIFVRTDVSQTKEVQALVARTVERFGGIDFAFNNAGIEGTPFTPLEQYSEETWDQVIAINLKGLFLSMKFELPEIVRRKGAIVNTSSVAGLKGGRMGTAYYASKHGVVGLTKSAALEYAGKGVRINAVAPAVIRTAMAERAFLHDEAIAARTTAMHPVGRIGEPDEVANAVIWLCSPAASFITGHTLPVDGGFLI